MVEIGYLDGVQQMPSIIQLQQYRSLYFQIKLFTHIYTMPSNDPHYSWETLSLHVFYSTSMKIRYVQRDTTLIQETYKWFDMYGQSRRYRRTNDGDHCKTESDKLGELHWYRFKNIFKICSFTANNVHIIPMPDFFSQVS